MGQSTTGLTHASASLAKGPFPPRWGDRSEYRTAVLESPTPATRAPGARPESDGGDYAFPREHHQGYRAAQLPGVSATVIPSGLDLSLFRPTPRDEARRRLDLPLDQPLVLFAGRPSQTRKRHGLALQAMEILRRSVPAELIVAWGVPPTEVPLYMNAADALVFTSMQEGSPNVVKEALAWGLPVVSVNVGDVAERLDGLEGCVLCPDERPETIAAGLERVLKDGRRIDAAAVVAALDEHVQTIRLIELYREVLQRPTSRKPMAQPRFSVLPGTPSSPD